MPARLRRVAMVQAKERAVRRVIFAMLLSVVPPVLLSVPLASAAVAVKAARPVVPKAQVVIGATRALAAEAIVHGMTIQNLVAKWQRVAICEEGGNWSMTGPRYSGIGFSNATWSQYGGSRYARLAGEATRAQQILIGMKVTHGWVPDQEGCSPTGW
jgi:Transglycosylase-like domain